MQVKVGTWNINNFFDRYQFHAPSREAPPDEWRLEAHWRKPRPRREVRHLADRLLLEAPDVMALQEVESPRALYDFNRDYLKSQYRYRIHIPTNDPRGLDVAVMSKLPLGRVTTRQHIRRGRKEIFSRDMLSVEILDPKARRRLFVLAVLHLKSKHVSYKLQGYKRMLAQRASAAKRRLEARTAAQEIRRLPGRVIVAGDFNDNSWSPSIKPLTRHRRLTDLGAQAPAPRWTIRDGGKARRFDYLLASKTLMRRYVKGTAHIERTKGKYSASDHHPMYATFNF